MGKTKLRDVIKYHFPLLLHFLYLTLCNNVLYITEFVNKNSENSEIRFKNENDEEKFI